MLNIIKKVFGLTPEAKLKKLIPIVKQIESYEENLLKQEDKYFAQRLNELSEHVNSLELTHEELQKKLEEILPETFAIVREASRRVLQMRHYPVQLLGGIVLHRGEITEMKTGEGKTLVATCPAVLNALTRRGVHIVTVNDYLASRDSKWMGRLYKFLGLSVGLIIPGQDPIEKREAYHSDILYSTNNELGFDYLRDNMADSLEMQARREPYYAIVDEVDSVLIDEARTPLIISGSPEASKQELYLVMNKLAHMLVKGEDKDDEKAEYYTEEKNKNAILTDKGIKKAEEMLGVDDLWDIRANLAHHLLQALKAKEFFKRDSEYIVQQDPETGKKEIVIVDEFTGRLMNGRRWSDGLHQAVEAKEAVPIQEESLTLAGITFQNFFKLYPKLAGMTGTALTEEKEFQSIYNLPVLPIPTNKPNIRKDLNDKVYKDEKQKFYAILEEIVHVNKTRRPILVGTTNIDKSELLSVMLSQPKASVELLQWRAKRLLDLLAKEESAEVLTKKIKKLLDRPVNIKIDSLKKILEECQIDEIKSTLDGDINKAIEKTLESSKLDDKDSDLDIAMKTLYSSIEVVEAIRSGIDHKVLNAKHHTQEAYIVAQAGRKGAVTIATNMAGRGTDIVLGGNVDFLAEQEIKKSKLAPDSLDYEAKLNEIRESIRPAIEEEQAFVKSQGGLHIIGTERHESRRIDNQLRGRASRQGDPGSTRFFLSLEDQLMRIFGGDRLTSAMSMLKTPDDVAIEAGIINKGIESAQKKIEGHNYEIRKRLLEYDDVSNTQRTWVYEQRQKVLEGYDLTNTFKTILDEQVEKIVYTYLSPEKPPETWYERELPEELANTPLDEIEEKVLEDYPTAIQKTVDLLQSEIPTIDQFEDKLKTDLFEEYSLEELIEYFKDLANQAFEKKREALGDKVFKQAISFVFLKSIDDHWTEHLQALDSLKEGIHLRGYGNKQPLIEYKKEAFEMFENELHQNIRKQSLQWMFFIEGLNVDEANQEQNSENNSLQNKEEVTV